MMPEREPDTIERMDAAYMVAWPRIWAENPEQSPVEARRLAMLAAVKELREVADQDHRPGMHIVQEWLDEHIGEHQSRAGGEG